MIDELDSRMPQGHEQGSMKCGNADSSLEFALWLSWFILPSRVRDVQLFEQSDRLAGADFTGLTCGAAFRTSCGR